MKDIQQTVDVRGIAIQRVGVKDVHLPFRIKTLAGGEQQVLATIEFTVSLPQEYKGTHMSRFLEILSRWQDQPVAEPEMEAILEEGLEKLEAETANLHIAFTYFVEKRAPVSGMTSVLDLACYFHGRKRRGEAMAFRLGVTVPATSLCPCSKEISLYGAHNQRSRLAVAVEFNRDTSCIYIEDLAELIEDEASSPVYPILKRVDEKYVTEYAYDHPKFVEDILRDLVLRMRALEGIAYFSVDCENFESIHNHNAFASHEETLN